MLAPLDIAVVIGWLVVSFAAGLWFSRRASGSTEDFFVSGRSLPWWVVGTSMVATTFAADTPLTVSGWVAKDGIAQNWIWWTFGLTGSVAVFLFARLWRRADILTDAELVELRYGPGAAWLRGAKAVWFGVFWNALVMAWVMKAMVKILGVVGKASGAYLPWFGNGFCDLADAKRVETFFGQPGKSVPGTKRNLALTLEGIDECARIRAATASQLKAWLSKDAKPAQ